MHIIESAVRQLPVKLPATRDEKRPILSKNRRYRRKGYRARYFIFDKIYELLRKRAQNLSIPPAKNCKI